MRKLLNNPAFVAVLVLAALVSVGWSFFAKPAAAPAPAAGWADTVVTENGEEPAVAAALSIPEALKVLAMPAITRDPFAITAKPESGVPASGEAAVPETVDRVRLSAIWVQGSAVYLLLNGRICIPGDRIDRFTVEVAEIAGAWIGFPGGHSFIPVGQVLAVKTSAQGLSTPIPQ